jgi:hypothetical protein
MGFFSNNTRKLIQQLKKHSEYYSHDLNKDITEMLVDLKADYEETSLVIPEFQAYISELKNRLDTQDAVKLEEFSKRLALVGRSAKKGVEAMWELSHNQRKLSAENLREYEAFEFQK